MRKNLFVVDNTGQADLAAIIAHAFETKAVTDGYYSWTLLE
ncbi:hypothetical protein [Halosimplex amylolyticum]